MRAHRSACLRVCSRLPAQVSNQFWSSSSWSSSRQWAGNEAGSSKFCCGAVGAGVVDSHRTLQARGAMECLRGMVWGGVD